MITANRLSFCHWQRIVVASLVIAASPLLGRVVCSGNPEIAEIGFADGLGPLEIGGKWGFIDEQGRIAIEPRFDNFRAFSDGVACVSVEHRWGYIDKKGNYVAKPNYDRLPPFREGLGVLRVGEKFGYIDASGKLVIPARFEMACCFSEGMARVTLDAQPAYIDHKGNVVLRPKVVNPRAFSDGLAAFYSDDKKNYGFIDHHGNIVIPAKLRLRGTVPFFNCGRAAIYLGWCSKYIDKSGKVVIPAIFDAASDFSEGLARVRGARGDGSAKFGFIDVDGKYVISPLFEKAGTFHDGLAPVSCNGRVGYIDHTGKFVIDLRGGEDGDNFCGGFAWVEGPKPHWFGYINTKGKYIWGPKEYPAR